MKSLYENTFQLGTNFKATFTEEVDKLIAQDLTVEFKNKLVQGITDAYVDQTGEVPDSYELTRLATWIVEDKSRDPDKVTNTEYPVLSAGQIKLRQRRELVSEYISESSDSTKHKINGKRKPKSFKVFGEYEGGY
jgi:hypothetical protein